MLKAILSACAGIAVFVGFMKLAGSQRYAEAKELLNSKEAIIALCLALFVGFGLRFKLRKKKINPAPAKKLRPDDPTGSRDK